MVVFSHTAGTSQSIIYKYHHNVFVPFQSIVTTGAQKWHAVTNPSGTLRLLALASDDGISFYLYNGWQFEKSHVSIASPSNTTSAVVNKIISFIQDGQVILGIGDNSTLNSNIFKLNFSVNIPVDQLHKDINSTCRRLKAKLAG